MDGVPFRPCSNPPFYLLFFLRPCSPFSLLSVVSLMFGRLMYGRGLIGVVWMVVMRPHQPLVFLTAVVAVVLSRGPCSMHEAVVELRSCSLDCGVSDV